MKGFAQDILDKYYYPNIKSGDVIIEMSDVVGSLDDQRLNRCDYLLISGEGYTPYYIAGARQTIKKFKPKILVAVNTETEMTAISDVVQFLCIIDLDYDFMMNVDHHTDLQRTYLYSWLNHGQRITPKPNPRRVVGSQKVGQVSVEEIQGTGYDKGAHHSRFWGAGPRCL